MEKGPQGENETFYIKCLFKTISFEDLKNQLLKRGFEISSDTYYVMTMKLRLSILEEEQCYQDIQKELKAELAFSKKKPERGYICSLTGCHYSTNNYKNLLKHLKMLHGASNQLLVCQLNGCS